MVGERVVVPGEPSEKQRRRKEFPPDMRAHENAAVADVLGGSERDARVTEHKAGSDEVPKWLVGLGQRSPKTEQSPLPFDQCEHLPLEDTQRGEESEIERGEHAHDEGELLFLGTKRSVDVREALAGVEGSGRVDKPICRPHELDRRRLAFAA